MQIMCRLSGSFKGGWGCSGSFKDGEGVCIFSGWWKVLSDLRSRRTCSIYTLSTFYCYLVFLRHVDPFGLTWLDLNWAWLDLQRGCGWCNWETLHCCMNWRGSCCSQRSQHQTIISVAQCHPPPAYLHNLTFKSKYDMRLGWHAGQVGRWVQRWETPDFLTSLNSDNPSHVWVSTVPCSAVGGNASVDGWETPTKYHQYIAMVLNHAASPLIP